MKKTTWINDNGNFCWEGDSYKGVLCFLPWLKKI